MDQISKPIGYLETRADDGTVEKSSKRLIGAIAFAIGGAILTALGVVSFFQKTVDPSTIQTVGNSFLLFGGGLLGIGVVEGFAKKAPTTSTVQSTNTDVSGGGK